MRRPVLLFWLWLVYSGLIAWCSQGQVSAQSQFFGGVTTESPTASTTDNPTYAEAYDEDTDLESATDDSVQLTTTLKTGRNFGSRIRGINSLPYGANSVGAAGSSNNDSQPFLRPRPTSTVISYNPTNYNRVLKRRKNTTTPSTLLTYKNIQSNNSFNNNVSANRTRSIGSVSNSSNVLQGSSQQNTSALHKVIILKRPRPVTISDSLTTTTSPPLTSTTTDAPSDLDIASSTDPQTTNAPAFKLPPPPPTNNASGSGNRSNSVFKSRDSSSKSSASLRARTRVRVSPVITPVLPSNALEAQPVSHSPVSSVPSFEYNPSVSIEDGVYRFRYSEPSYSSKRVHTEEYGVSHVTYGDDEDRETETTTYAPPEDTTRPFQIDIDGSEEEFTSSLPPAYREYFSQEDSPENQRRPPPMANVPIPSIRSAEPVTVTVTHTVVSATAASASSTVVIPTELASASKVKLETDNSHANTIPIIRGNANVNVSRLSEDESNRENVIRSTPTLPSLNSIQVSAPNVSWTNVQLANVNQSERESMTSSSPTTEALNTPVVVNKSNAIAPAEASIVPSVTNGDGEQNGQGTHHASAQPQNININGTISPTVSSKVVTSVFYTKQENPYYTTSSYSFTHSTVYSYGDPPGDHDHDHDHDGHYDHDHEQDNSQKQQQLRPTTTTYWDSLGYKSATVNQSQYPDSASNSSDQDIGYSTPEADTEYPPHFFGDRTTTPMPDSEPDDHSEADNEIDDHGSHTDDTHKDDGTVTLKQQPRPNALPNDFDSLIPTVPVFIQVLLDMPAHVFCLSISGFKQMIARVYEPERDVTPDQVIVFNEQNCNNVTGTLGNYSQPLNHSGVIKYATTTASVTKTLSSSTARSVARASGNYSNYSTPPSYSGVRLRSRRHGHDHLVPYDTRDNEINETDVSESLTLYPVFFYLNNQNGSYDQLLTESFIQLWNLTKDANHSVFFDKIRKVEMVSPTQEMTSHAPDNENSGIIAAITIASIAAICLVLLGVLLVVMRHRQAQTKFAKRCTPVSLDDYSLDNISVYNSFRRKQRNRASKRSYTNAAFDDPNAPSRPCNAMGLTTALQDESKLEEEFRDLPSVNPTMDDIPSGAETKNRYANVIPMPDTRVLLTFQEDIPNSDYINANFIRGPMSTSKGYIITQAPLEETIVDFWRMVWEQQIRVIMMLTDFSEAGIPKCAEYYPRSETVDSSQLHGDFQITLEKRDITENCITSYLVIKDMERNLRRDVIHLWYHSWPDKGVPVNPKCTMDFLLKSRKFTKEPTPVLVHCSPGTGRSGTVVACDVAMREFDTQHNVNIPRTVMKIRQDRAGAVQTKDQYLHIYQVVQSYASRTAISQLDSI